MKRNVRASLSVCTVLAATVLAALPAAAEDLDGHAVPAEVAGFDKFMMTSSPLCSFQPSLECVNAGWRFADSNKDGYLELGEVMEVRANFAKWLDWKSPQMPASQRTGVAIGMLILDTIGLPNIFAGLNTSGSGKLSKTELLKDINLDARPLGAVLSDPKAVDRKAIAKRVGRFAPIVNSMLGGGEQESGAKPAK